MWGVSTPNSFDKNTKYGSFMEWQGETGWYLGTQNMLLFRKGGGVHIYFRLAVLSEKGLCIFVF